MREISKKVYIREGDNVSLQNAGNLTGLLKTLDMATP